MRTAFFPSVILRLIGALGLVPSCVWASVPTLPAPGAPAVPGAPADALRDIAPPVDLPFWTPKMLAVAVVGALLFVGLVILLIRRWQNRARPCPAPPDPVQTALRALEKLANPSAEPLLPKEFAAAVSKVIRRFLEAKHGLAAPRQTTEEFLAVTERSNRFNATVQEQIRTFLGRCDALKFAPPGAADDARAALLSVAFKLVREDLA